MAKDIVFVDVSNHVVILVKRMLRNQIEVWCFGIRANCDEVALGLYYLFFLFFFFAPD